ncbi:uncharacterized protein LOC144607509 [Rhinoraja longicauda]
MASGHTAPGSLHLEHAQPLSQTLPMAAPLEPNVSESCGIVKSVSAFTYVFSCGGFTGRYINVIIPGPAKTLTLCEVQVFASKLPSLPDAGNVAPRAEAIQSSTFESAGAERAIDGNRNSSFMRDSCTHTMKSTNPWWRADLKQPHNVSVVRITNRRDCCSELLTGAQIRIGNSLENDGNANRLCGTIHSASGTTFTFNCGGRVGRYVNIIIPGRGKTLVLCEVEIFGSELPSIFREENVAAGAPPIQSSTHGWAGPERANDGNSDSDFRHGSCARTRKSTNPWWRVDLKERYKVSDIRITNRADCCSDQLQGAEIRIGDSLENDGNSNRLCATVESASTTLSIKCGRFVGQYVNIIIPGLEKTLTLCEVEIFDPSTSETILSTSSLSKPFTILQVSMRSPLILNSSESSPVPSSHSFLGLFSTLGCSPSGPGDLSTFRPKRILLINVAFGAPPTQSSTYRGAGAERANDGNNDNNFADGSCTQTNKSKNPWWRVDLIDSYNVSAVRITNRADCCWDRLQGAEVRIGDSVSNDGNPNRLYLFGTGASGGIRGIAVRAPDIP